MIKGTIDEAEKLQEGHGGWNEDMAKVIYNETIINFYGVFLQLLKLIYVIILSPLTT